MAAPIQNITFRRRLLISIPENSIFFGVFLYICILCFCIFEFCIFVCILSLLMGIPPLTSDARRKQSVLIRKRHLSMPMILRWERSDLESDFQQMQHCQSVVRWNFRNPPLLENLIKKLREKFVLPFYSTSGGVGEGVLGGQWYDFHLAQHQCYDSHQGSCLQYHFICEASAVLLGHTNKDEYSPCGGDGGVNCWLIWMGWGWI